MRMSDGVKLSSILLRRDRNGQITTVYYAGAHIDDYDVDIFGHFPNITHLHLDDNRIRYIPLRFMRKMTQLKSLSFDKNPLLRLPASISHLTQLLSLSFHECPNIPAELTVYRNCIFRLKQIGEYYGAIERRERLAVAAIMRYVRARSAPDIARMIGQMVWQQYERGEYMLK